MKKIALVVIAAASLGGCSWFQQSSDWADRTFFDSNNPPQNPGQPGTNYPYYYTSASPIDANEKAAYNSPYPPAAPGSINNSYAGAAYAPYGQPQYTPNPSSPQAVAGGYGSNPNAPSVNVQYGSKGTDVSSAKTGEYIKNPEPKLPTKNDMTRAPAQQPGQPLPPLQGTQGQYTPQYGYPQQAPVPPVIAPAMPTQAPPPPYGYPTGAPQAYGQPAYPPQAYPPSAPYGQQPQYQYPAPPYSNPYPYSPNK